MKTEIEANWIDVKDKNVFVVVTKTVNGKFKLYSNGELLPIYSARKDAERFLHSQSHNTTRGGKLNRWTIRRINLVELINLIK